MVSASNHYGRKLKEILGDRTLEEYAEDLVKDCTTPEKLKEYGNLTSPGAKEALETLCDNKSSMRERREAIGLLEFSLKYGSEHEGQ